MKCNKPECYRNGNLCEHPDDCPEREGSGASPCSPIDHLVMLHRVLYNKVTDREALDYLNRFRREDADFADLGRPLKFQYQENVEDKRG